MQCDPHHVARIIPSPLSPAAAARVRREAQRALRLALTAFKQARSDFRRLCDDGYEQASEVVNLMLMLTYVAASEAQQGALASVPSLQDAALAKIARRLQAAMGRISVTCSALSTLAAGLPAVAADLMAIGSTPEWSGPVFGSIPMQRAADLLTGIAVALGHESDLRQRLLLGFKAEAEACTASLNRGPAAVQRLRAEMTVYLATWLAAPYMDNEGAEMALAALTDDMHGF